MSIKINALKFLCVLHFLVEKPYDGITQDVQKKILCKKIKKREEKKVKKEEITACFQEYCQSNFLRE